MNSYSLKIDFAADWVDHLRSQLDSLGYPVDTTEAPENVAQRFFNLMHRRIESKPRKALESSDFTCPDNHHLGLTEFKRKVQAGEDLNPHLSRKLPNLSYNDLFLNDWGIQHFHLGMAPDPKHAGMIQGTKELLFAIVKPDAVYMIDVRGHGAWGDKDLLEIVNRDWPFLLDRFRLNVPGLEYEPTTSERLLLRGKHCNVPIQLADGTVLAAIGGGIMGNGGNSQALMESDYHFRVVEEMERIIRSNIDEIVEGARDAGVEMGRHFHFKLVIDENGPSAVELNSMTSVQFSVE